MRSGRLARRTFTAHGSAVTLKDGEYLVLLNDATRFRVARRAKKPAFLEANIETLITKAERDCVPRGGMGGMGRIVRSVSMSDDGKVLIEIAQERMPDGGVLPTAFHGRGGAAPPIHVTFDPKDGAVARIKADGK
jgi:hypothetical protein